MSCGHWECGCIRLLLTIHMYRLARERERVCRIALCRWRKGERLAFSLGNLLFDDVVRGWRLAVVLVIWDTLNRIRLFKTTGRTSDVKARMPEPARWSGKSPSTDVVTLALLFSHRKRTATLSRCPRENQKKRGFLQKPAQTNAYPIRPVSLDFTTNCRVKNQTGYRFSWLVQLEKNL